MKEFKCLECGAELAQGATECPSCGCPIAQMETEQAIIAKEKKPKKINIMSIISLLLGVVIIIMGVVVMNKEISIDTYTARNYSVDYAAFGGDFYTEIYGASDVIVDELNDINGGIALLSESLVSMVNVIYYPVGMMIIAIGIGVVAVSCNHIRKENM